MMKPNPFRGSNHLTTPSTAMIWVLDWSLITSSPTRLCRGRGRHWGPGAGPGHGEKHTRSVERAGTAANSGVGLDPAVASADLLATPTRRRPGKTPRAGMASPCFPDYQDRKSTRLN